MKSIRSKGMGLVSMSLSVALGTSLLAGSAATYRYVVTASTASDIFMSTLNIQHQIRSYVRPGESVRELPGVTLENGAFEISPSIYDKGHLEPYGVSVTALISSDEKVLIVVSMPPGMNCRQLAARVGRISSDDTVTTCADGEDDDSIIVEFVNKPSENEIADDPLPDWDDEDRWEFPVDGPGAPEAPEPPPAPQDPEPDEEPGQDPPPEEAEPSDPVGEDEAPDEGVTPGEGTPPGYEDDPDYNGPPDSYDDDPDHAAPPPVTGPPATGGPPGGSGCQGVPGVSCSGLGDGTNPGQGSGNNNAGGTPGGDGVSNPGNGGAGGGPSGGGMDHDPWANEGAPDYRFGDLIIDHYGWGNGYGISDWVDLGSILPEPMPFTITGPGNPRAADITGQHVSEGIVRWGTNIYVDLPLAGESHTVRLDVGDGFWVAEFTVQRLHDPNSLPSEDGTYEDQVGIPEAPDFEVPATHVDPYYGSGERVPSAWMGGDRFPFDLPTQFSIVGDGNPTMMTSDGSLSDTGELASWGTQLWADLPPCGVTHTAVITVASGEQGIWKIVRPDC